MIEEQSRITNYFINRMQITLSGIKLIFSAVILLCSILITSCSDNQQHWQNRELKLLGTTVRIQVNHQNKNIRQKAINDIIAEFSRIESKFSPFKETSEISHINKAGYTQELRISDEMKELLSFSLNISTLTNGAFDITFASVGHLFDFRKKTGPDNELFKDNFKGVSYKHITLNKNIIRFNNSKTQISFGGFAKGYAIKKSIEILKSYGIENALVTAGGDSMVIGLKNGEQWKTGIKAPRGELRTVYSFPLTNKAISTSGDYERYFESNGRRVHHIINPISGKSARGIQSVTVIGPDPMMTDALSTAMFIIGTERAMNLCEKAINIEALIIDESGKLHKSSGFPNHQTF